MTIKEMHYDFKFKFNKVDSQQNRNLIVPEIDWVLNQAYQLFVKMIVSPRLRSQLGFEMNQRSIDEIRVLVKNSPLPVSGNGSDTWVVLPEDYWTFLDGTVNMFTDSCGDREGRIHIRQHGEDFKNSPFDKSSYRWKFINATFNNLGLNFHTEDFNINACTINYIKKLEYIHNAAGYRTGGYTSPDGTALTGTRDCELPDSTHYEIVDLAVLLMTGNLQVPDYQIKLNKLSFNNLKN